MLSKIFYSDQFKTVEAALKLSLNTQADFLSLSTSDSPRAVGDAIQSLLASNFRSIIGEGVCKEYSDSFARRAMADLAFLDFENFYYIIDVKTHRMSTKFNMPNLTSVERLVRFYEDDKNYFIVLMVSYEVIGNNIRVDGVHFVPIEFLSWRCLTIGALGWGQIQIANSNNIVIVEKNSRREWMLQLCNTLMEFYPKEISKINKRMLHFEKVRESWLKKPELAAAIPKTIIEEELK